jgi:hypothetical protein
MSDIAGAPVRDLGVFQKEQAERFEFEFVEPAKLTEVERNVFSTCEAVVQLGGGLPSNVHRIMISEQLCPDLLNGTQTQGLWDEAQNRIIIKRSELASVCSFAGILLHEITHARTGYCDVTREFETALTALLGRVASSRIATGDANRQLVPHGGSTPSFWQRVRGA